MARESFVIDLRFDGGRQAERVLESLGDTSERSMRQLSQSTQPARRGLRAIDDVSREVRGQFDELANRLGPIGAGMRALGPAGTAAAAGIAGVTAGLTQMLPRAEQAAQRFAELGEQADQIGISTQALQELQFAAGQVGVEEERLEDGLQELQSRLGELRNEAGPLNSALEQMGADKLRQALVSAEDTDEAFQAIIRTMRESGDGFDNAALAAAAFSDEAGRAMRRLANEDLPKLRQSFRDLGIAVDEDLIRQSQEARGELTELDTRIQNNIDVISAELLPVLVRGKEAYADFTSEIRNAADAITDGDGLLSAIRELAAEIPLIGTPGSVRGFNAQGLGLTNEGDALAQSDRRQFFGNQANLLNPNMNLPPNTQVSQFLGFDEAARSLDRRRGTPEVNVGPGLPPGLFQGPNTIAGVTVDPSSNGGGGPGVPTPGTRPETPDGFGGGGGGNTGTGTPDRLSFAGVDFNDPFTMNDALRETDALFQDLEERVREQAEAFAQAEGEARNFTDQSQELGRVIATDLSRSFERVGDEITRSFARGESAAIDFGSVARGVLSDVAQTALELGVINPLQNMIFGTDRQTLSGVGGFLGDVLGNIALGGGGGATNVGSTIPNVSSGASGSFSFADGGSFTVGGAFPGINAGRDNRLVSFAARDGERVDVRRPGQSPEVSVQVINQGQPAQVERTERRVQADGKTQLKVFLRSEMKNAINDGSLDKSLEGNFGLSRQGKR